jgi:hypothetical protein
MHCEEKQIVPKGITKEMGILDKQKLNQQWYVKEMEHMNRMNTGSMPKQFVLSTKRTKMWEGNVSPLTGHLV